MASRFFSKESAHTEKASEIADQVGLLLWEEIPVDWAIAFDKEETYEDASNQLKELILKDRNRASVITWSVGNENPDTDQRLLFMSRLVALARELDGTRPVTAACLVNHVKMRIEDRLADELGIIGLNEYYGWYEPDFERLRELLENSTPQNPVLISEMGAGAVAGQRGTEEELFSEERQRAVYREQIAAIRDVPYVAGMTPWILYDFRSPRRTNRFQRGYNRKGLLSEDKRKKKLAYWTLRDFYQEVP